MAISDGALETYTHVHVQMDPSSKLISTVSKDKSIQDAVASVNNIHTSLKTLDTPTPPAPLPVNPKRSAQIAKLRDSANTAARKGQYTESLRLWTFAIDMASGRPGWEPMGLVREELAALYLARANSQVGAQNWVEGWKDSECSLECKRGQGTGPKGEKIPGNPKAFLLGGKCLLELGRWTEASEWLERGTEIEGTDGEDGKGMVKMLVEARRREADDGFKR